MIHTAKYLIAVLDGATALCEAHARAFQNIMLAAGQEPQIWAMDPDDDPRVCQACDLVDQQRPRIILPH